MIEAATSARGYDAAGNLLGYTVQEISGGTVRWTDTYSYEYSLQDGYLETKVTGTSSDRNRRASETLSSYDGWGRRTSVEERTNLRDFKQTLRSARYFAYDAEGGLISRREGELVEVQGQALQFRQARKEDARFKNVNPVPHLIEQTAWNAMSAGEREYWAGAANTHRYSFANGQLLGSVNEAGRMSVGDRLTGFENSSLGASTVVVRSGETLRSVAQRIYGDGSLWYVLADANGLTNSDETLAEGQNLQVPQVGTNTNSASTFKPFDPSEQIGPTAPSLPTIAPPPKNSCNPVAQLLMVIVSVAVSFVTYGLINPGSTLAAIGAGAASGAAGAAASGVVGSITGVSSFSWRNVAAGAVTGAITAGIAQGIGPVNGEIASVGRLLDAGRPLAAAGMALGNAAAGYIGSKVAGVQGTSFSWRNIAGSAVGSMISSAAFNKLEWNQPGAFEKSGSFGQTLVTGFVGGLVSAHTQKAFGAEVNVNEGRMALDAFGNAIGNALGGAINDSVRLNKTLRKIASEFGEESPELGRRAAAIAGDRSIRATDRRDQILGLLNGASVDQVVEMLPEGRREIALAYATSIRQGGNAGKMMLAAFDGVLDLPETSALVDRKAGTKRLVIGAIHDFVGAWNDSEAVKSALFNSETPINQLLITIGAGIHSGFEGLKSLAGLVFDAGSSMIKAQLYMAKQSASVAYDLVTGNWDGLRQTVKSQRDQLAGLTGRGAAIAATFADGMATLGVLLDDDDIRSAMVLGLGDMVAGTSRQTWLFGLSSFVFETVMSFGTSWAGRGVKSVDSLADAAGAMSRMSLRGNAARLGRTVDEVTDVAGAARALGIMAGEYRSAAEAVDIARMATKFGNVPGAWIREADVFARSTGTMAERTGLMHGYLRMRNAGWRPGETIKNGSGHGLDGVFYKDLLDGTREYAILEAKSSGDLSSLAQTSAGRQGTADYIRRQIGRARDLSVADSSLNMAYREMLGAFDAGRVRSFASFGPATDRLVEIPSSWSGGALPRSANLGWQFMSGIGI